MKRKHTPPPAPSIAPSPGKAGAPSLPVDPLAGLVGATLPTSSASRSLRLVVTTHSDRSVDIDAHIPPCDLGSIVDGFVHGLAQGMRTVLKIERERRPIATKTQGKR